MIAATTAICSPLTTYRACRPGYPIRSAGPRAGTVSRSCIVSASYRNVSEATPAVFEAAEKTAAAAMLTVLTQSAAPQLHG